MPKKTIIVNYTRCQPEKCDSGICRAARECTYLCLKQEAPYEIPKLNPSKWCHGCAKCVKLCPFHAIEVT